MKQGKNLEEFIDLAVWRLNRLVSRDQTPSGLREALSVEGMQKLHVAGEWEPTASYEALCRFRKLRQEERLRRIEKHWDEIVSRFVALNRS